MEAPHVKKHLPLITARIEFSVTTTPKPPMITPRMDLGKRLKLKRDPSISDDEERTPKRRRQSFSPAHDDGTDVESLSSLSDITSEDESASANYTMLGKVPKPPGEAGRPGSGGYNLEERLGWPKKEYDEMVKYIHEASKRELEISKSFKQQKTSIIDKICKEALRRFPNTERYENLWPIRDVLKLHLKYTSESARRLKSKAITKKLEKAVRGSAAEHNKSSRERSTESED